MNTFLADHPDGKAYLPEPEDIVRINGQLKMLWLKRKPRMIEDYAEYLTSLKNRQLPIS